MFPSVFVGKDNPLIGSPFDCYFIFLYKLKLSFYTFFLLPWFSPLFPLCSQQLFLPVVVRVGRVVAPRGLADSPVFLGSFDFIIEIFSGFGCVNPTFCCVVRL